MEKNSEAKKLLQESRLFKSFSPEIIDFMAPALTPCHFQIDNLICLKGDASDCLYIIREGKVEISVSSSEGKIIVLGTLTRGDVFGEVGLLDKNSRTANVTALTDVSLYRLSSSEFDRLKEFFGAHELTALTSYICSLFRRATNNLEETVFLDAGIRIAKKICELYEKDGNKTDKNFIVSLSQENLGRLAGLSREATNKALSRLEDEGLIKREYKKILIPDMPQFLQSQTGS